MTEKILEERKISKWFQDYIEKENIKEENIKSIISSTEYFEWIKDFIKDEGEFCDDQWLYFPEKTSESDLTNIKKLCLFYEGIDRYARRNHYYPVNCKFGNYYRIKYNDLGFDIGVMIGQGTVFFCRAIAIDDESKFIDFNNIMMNKSNPQLDIINTKLGILSDLILSTYESGVPIESISNVLNSTINEVLYEKKNPSKTMIKK